MKMLFQHKITKNIDLTMKIKIILFPKMTAHNIANTKNICTKAQLIFFFSDFCKKLKKIIFTIKEPVNFFF